MKNINIEELKKRLINIFNKDDAFVITLSGEWGVGKTYFWNEFEEKHLKNKQVAYVSLFGKNKIEDIREAIILQISKTNKFLKKIHKNIGSIGYQGLNLSSALSLFKKEYFKKIIVTFDDFERKPEALELKDILGLISELKEEKECKIIMILHQGELLEGEAKNFSKYKDKIIDYEFQYKPTPAESFDLIKNKLKAFKNYPLKDYFQRKNINNIRIIRRVINALNDFCFIERQVANDEEVKKEILSYIIAIAAINAEGGNFENLEEYEKKKRLNQPEPIGDNIFEKNTDFEKNTKFEKLLSYFENDYQNTRGGIGKFIIQYIKTSIPDKEQIEKIIQENIKNSNKYKIKGEINECYNKLHFNMEYKISQFIKEVWLLFNKHSEIVSFLGLEFFIQNIKEFKKLDPTNEKKYRDFAFQRLKFFFKSNKLDWWGTFGLEDLEKFDKNLYDFYKEKLNTENLKKINSMQGVIEIMKEIVERNIIAGNEEILSQIKKEDLKKYILESQNFLQTADSFLYNINQASPPSFVKYRSNLIAVFKELAKSKNENYQYKMKNLLKHEKEYTKNKK